MRQPHIIQLADGQTNHLEDPRLNDLPIHVRVEIDNKGGRVIVTVAGYDIASLPLFAMVDLAVSVYRPRGT